MGSCEGILLQASLSCLGGGGRSRLHKVPCLDVKALPFLPSRLWFGGCAPAHSQGCWPAGCCPAVCGGLCVCPHFKLLLLSPVPPSLKVLGVNHTAPYPPPTPFSGQDPVALANSAGRCSKIFTPNVQNSDRFDQINCISLTGASNCGSQTDFSNSFWLAGLAFLGPAHSLRVTIS